MELGVFDDELDGEERWFVFWLGRVHALACDSFIKLGRGDRGWRGRDRGGERRREERLTRFNVVLHYDIYCKLSSALSSP
jgi:hypothetical protein